MQDDKDKIKYPNRKATFLMRTNQFLSLLDHDGLEEQENNIAKQKVAETKPISIGLGNDRSVNSGSSSSSSGTYKSVSGYRSFHPAAASSSQMARRPEIYAMSEDSGIDSEAGDLDDYTDEQQKTIEAKGEAAAELGRHHLGEAEHQATRHILKRIYGKPSEEEQLNKRESFRRFPRSSGSEPEHNSDSWSESWGTTREKII